MKQANRKKTAIRFAKKAVSTALMAVGAAGLGILLSQVAYAGEGTVQDIDMIDNLGATVKSILKGPGSKIIDGVIIAGGGWATAKTSSPGPVVGAIVSVGLFELFLKLVGIN